MSRDLDRAELTRTALGVAREAASLVEAGYRKSTSVVEKNRFDLVTEYDLRSEDLIRTRLMSLTPELPMIGEERGGHAASDATWYCDPLDGTTNFAHGHPFWSVSIGLLEQGQATVGAVVAPSLGLWWTGYRGGPALRCGQPCRVSATTKLARALLATGFPTAGEREQEPGSNLLTFVSVMKEVRGVRRCGSAAIDLCLVADGTYDAFWERRLNAWDLAAGAAIVTNAGGHLSSLSGGPVDLMRGHLIASNGAIHDSVVDLLAPFV